MSKKVMKLISPYTGEMECKVCGVDILQVLNPGVMVNITVVPGSA